MRKTGSKRNICANLEMSRLLRRQAAASDPELVRLITDAFGQNFSVIWQCRRQEIGQGYAALLCRILESGPAGIRTDAVSKRGKTKT